MTAILATPTPATLPPTGVDRLFEAAEFVATRAPKVHMSAHRALSAVLLGEPDITHVNECKAMAAAWFRARYGSASAWHAFHDAAAAGALMECACYYRRELSGGAR